MAERTFLAMAIDKANTAEENTTEPFGRTNAEVMCAKLALGGVLPAGKATLAPRTEMLGEKRKPSPPPANSGEWF